MQERHGGRPDPGTRPARAHGGDATARPRDAAQRLGRRPARSSRSRTTRSSASRTPRRRRPRPRRPPPPRTAPGAPRRSSGRRRPPWRGSPAPSSSMRSGASVERSRPRSGSRCSRITRSGNRPWVAHTFRVSTSCSPRPARPPLVRERGVDVAVADHDLARRRAPAGSPRPRSARGAAANSSASLRASSLPVFGSSRTSRIFSPSSRPPGLARHQHVEALLPQVRLGQPDLRPLARALHALEGDEQPGGGRPLQLRHEDERLRVGRDGAAGAAAGC